MRETATMQPQPCLLCLRAASSCRIPARLRRLTPLPPFCRPCLALLCVVHASLSACLEEESHAHASPEVSSRPSLTGSSTG